MKLVTVFFTIAFAIVNLGNGLAQQAGPGFAKSASDTNDMPLALPNAATEPQIRKYLRVSGDEDKFRKSWIAAVDKNRSIGAPYWPESFWQAVKDEMQKTDLAPMYITFLRHGVSQELMQEVLVAYKLRGPEHFQGSPECFKLGAAMAAVNADYEKLRLAETWTVVSKVYDEYKPQIKAARARYLAEHPDWKDK